MSPGADTQQTRFDGRLELGIPLLVFVLIAAGSFWLARSLQHTQSHRLEIESAAMAARIGERIETLVAPGATAVEHLAAEWNREYARDPDAFTSGAGVFMSNSPGLVALLQLDASGTIRSSTPPEWAPNAIGRTLTSPALQRAREAGAPVRTPIGALADGSLGYSVFAPIPGAGDGPAGFVAARVRIRDLLDSISADPSLRAHFAFSISEAGGSALLYSGGEPGPAARQSIRVHALDRPWILELAPTPLRVQEVDTPADGMLLAGGLALGTIVAGLAYLLLLRQRGLRASERRYRELFENAPIPLWEEDFSGVLEYIEALRRRGVEDLGRHLADHPDAVLECARRVKVLDVNPAAMELHGAHSKEELLAGLERILTDSSLEVFREEILAILAGRTRFESEAMVRTLDGEERNVRLWLRADSDRSRVLFSNIDITDAKRAGEKLERLAMAINQSNDGIFISDADGVITYANDALCRMVETTPDELVGRSVRLIAKEFEVLDVYDEASRSVRDRGISWSRRYSLRLADGSLSYREATATPVLDDNGRLTSTVSLVREVTREVQLEERMRHSQKLESLGVLAGGIAHDFNNLLVSILGNADLARREISLSAPAQPHLDSLVSAAQRAADLCQQLLAYSGKGHFVVRPLDLSKLVGETAHLLEMTLSQKARIEYDLPASLPAVEVDATQLRQVLLNLVSNASDAIGSPDGVIRISTGAVDCTTERLRASYVDANLPAGIYSYVEVNDTGRGMDAETLSRIFDPFYTTKHAGHGLGLAAVLGIVRGHRGALEIESEPGLGSCFRFLLPASDRAVVETPAGPSPDEDWQSAGAILVVDDEATVRDLASKILRRAGFSVLTAEDGRAGVDVLQRHAAEIDLVLLDLTMPHMSGQEAFTEMRRIAPDLRVIVSSGYSEQDATVLFSEGGLAGFVQKPYTVSALLGTVRAALASRQAAR